MTRDEIDKLPDGYYLISTKNEFQKSLVYLYDHPDFNGVRHIAFGAQDGAALMPIWDVTEDTVFEPVEIIASDKAITIKEL